jgi:hypothetical protein
MVLHIRKNIDQSNQYDQTKEPPVWKYGTQKL